MHRARKALRKQLEQTGNHVEAQILNLVAEQDVDKALEVGRKTLAKGFKYELINVLKKIYEKDAEKGIAFGEEMVRKLRGESIKPENLYYIGSMLATGVESLEQVKGKSGKKPLFSEQNLRELAEVLAQGFLRSENFESYETTAHLGNIEKFLPARAAQIKQKLAANQRKNQVAVAEFETPPPPMPTRMSGETIVEKEDLAENLQNLGTKEMPAEERQKVVGKARKMIAEIEDRSAKLMALSGLATQVVKLGDKDLAAEIMKEAEGLVNPQPKNYRDYMESWLLASGYAQVNTDKSFPILEEAILRLNETISAFVKVGEFIDVNGDMIDDGEVQVGSFGGQMTREMLNSIGATDTTITSLAKADFTRTKSLAGNFDRMEVRILAKMLILRAVLGNEKKKIVTVDDRTVTVSTGSIEQK